MEPTLEERINLMEELLTPIYALCREVHDRYNEFEYANHNLVFVK